MTPLNRTIPICPFCWGSLGYPKEMQLSDTETVLGGQCYLCGARFLVDVTGKNVGEVMVQGLRLVAEELGKTLEMLEDGEDYDDCVLCYDVKCHQCLGAAPRFLDGYGRLYVIRVKKRDYH